MPRKVAPEVLAEIQADPALHAELLSLWEQEDAARRAAESVKAKAKRERRKANGYVPKDRSDYFSEYRKKRYEEDEAFRARCLERGRLWRARKQA